MLTISIYGGDQRSNAHVAFDGDLSQTVPELFFKADAGVVVCNLNRALRRALRNRKVQPSPQMCHRYYVFLNGGRTGNGRSCTGYSRSRIRSRLRWSWSKSNCLMAAASALSRSGASTEPRYSPLLRMMRTRQLRS